MWEHTSQRWRNLQWSPPHLLHKLPPLLPPQNRTGPNQKELHCHGPRDETSVGSQSETMSLTAYNVQARFSSLHLRGGQATLPATSLAQSEARAPEKYTEKQAVVTIITQTCSRKSEENRFCSQMCSRVWDRVLNKNIN
jgi:hypothetical protein